MPGLWIVGGESEDVRSKSARLDKGVIQFSRMVAVQAKNVRL